MAAVHRRLGRLGLRAGDRHRRPRREFFSLIRLQYVPFQTDPMPERNQAKARVAMSEMTIDETVPPAKKLCAPLLRQSERHHIPKWDISRPCS